MANLARLLLLGIIMVFSFSTPALAQSKVGEIIDVVGLQAHPSDVDIGNARAWPRINVDPFRGSVDQASLVLNPKTNIRPFEYHEAFAMRTRGECHRYQFGPTDQFRSTFGRDKSMLANPGFTGWADVCLVRADGSAVIFPDGCANIGPGLAIVRRREAPVSRTEQTKPAPPPVTQRSTVTMTVIPGQIIGGGTTITNSCWGQSFFQQGTIQTPARVEQTTRFGQQ